MPRRNHTAPTNPTTVPVPDNICGDCNNPIEGNEESVLVITTDGTQRWHQECFNDDGFYCASCNDCYDIDHSESHEYRDDLICHHCWEEYFTQCDRCNETINQDNTYRIFIEDGEERFWCESCRDESSRHSDYDNTYCATSAYRFVPIAGDGQVTTHDIDHNPRDFIRCAGSGIQICLPLRETWMEYNGQVISIEFAEEHGYPIPRRNTATIRNRMTEGYRGDISSARAELKAKVINNMSNRPAPSANPYHDKIFLGIELEAQAGYYFIDAPHKTLHTQLPDTRIVHDGSIRGEGWEFLPPIIKRKKDWEKIEKLITTLNEFKWTADSTCGLHLHLSHGMLSSDHPEVVRNIFRMFYWLEPIIFNCLPLNRRDNKYCYPISKYFDEKDMGENLKLDYWYYSNFWKKRIRRQDGNGRQPHYRYDNRGQAIDAIEFGDGPYKKQNMAIDKQEHYYVGRYIGCNLHALFQKGTLELRYFPAFLDYAYIHNWAEIITRIVQAGIDNIKIEPIIEMSKGRGNMEKAIKDMSGIFKLPKVLSDFMKMEYRKYLKNPELPEPEHQTLQPFVNARSGYRQFEQRTHNEPAQQIRVDATRNGNGYRLTRQDGMHWNFDTQAHEILMEYIMSHMLPTIPDFELAQSIVHEIERIRGVTLDPMGILTWIQAHFLNLLPTLEPERQDRPRDEHGRFAPRREEIIAREMARMAHAPIVRQVTAGYDPFNANPNLERMATMLIDEEVEN